MQPYGRELCEIPYVLFLHTNSMSRYSDKLKTVYKIKPKEFSDDIEHHLYPAYVEVTKAVRSYRISEMMTKVYSSKSKANETVNKIQTRMTNNMMNEIASLGGFKTRRGSGYARFNEIRDLITTKFFDLEEIEVE
tara:strand:+ start:1386 stop:1790 length:405 start_codon:yes stop_codon:yes gene_type:complete